MSPVRDEGDESLKDLLGPLDGEVGPARRLSRRKSASLVMAAMEAGAREVSSRPLARRKRPPVWLMTGAVLFAGAAAAAVWSFARSEHTSEPEVTRSPSEPSRRGPAGDSAPTSSGMAPPASERVVAPAPRAVSAEPPVGTPAAVAAPHVAAVPGVPAPLEAARREAAPPAVRAPRQETSAQISNAPAPEDLLLMANELRARGRWKEAEGLYLRAIRAQPSSLAAYVARVASGSLRLEHLGNARGALLHFEEALRLQPHGVLSEEARHGIAEAWRALGDRAAETRALNEFLARHPDSPLVATARARLRELSIP